MSRSLIPQEEREATLEDASDGTWTPPTNGPDLADWTIPPSPQQLRSEETRGVVLPGYGSPLAPYHTPLRDATESWYARPITVRERVMIALMAALKDKAGWDRKVFDEEIVSRWRAEAVQSIPSPPTGGMYGDDNSDRKNGENIDFDGTTRQKTVSARMFDYCIAELRESAVSMRESGIVAAIDANAIVYMSDTALDNQLKEALKAAVASLENIPEPQKDWHPGSDGKVLDIVHPSLCPLIYGRTKILPSGRVPLLTCHEYSGKGEVVPIPEYVNKFCSKNFQWLPCEVELDERGKTKITSYINNLRPLGNETLYKSVEEVIAKSVPLWIECLLSTIRLPKQDRMHGVGGGYIFDNADDVPHDDLENDDFFKVPEPRSFGKRTRGSANDLQEQRSHLRNRLLATGMQVIVKLANIHLTPEKPQYDGGTWHIEGQMNEHICASSLYYYDEENITPSYLAFREGVEHERVEWSAEQDRYDALCSIYGIKNEVRAIESALQVLGKVLTRENRLLAFPNVLQHRVSPFELVDKSKPGHRKLLALFLVDPYNSIPSTANVPPQQAEWWVTNPELDTVFGRFPREIADQVVDELDFPIGMEEAKRVREQLIEERKQFVDNVDQVHAEYGYSFCEH